MKRWFLYQKALTWKNLLTLEMIFFLLKIKTNTMFLGCLEKKKNELLLVVQGFLVEVGCRSEV